MKTEAQVFILDNTTVMTPPHVPEISLHLATEAHDLWLKTQEELEAIGLPPPYWAFAWAGQQGLARYLLDHGDVICGKSVLDFASGSGLVAIAAKQAGAGAVTGCDIDPWSSTATAMNAGLNDTAIAMRCDNIIGTDDGWQVVLAGDVFYDQALAGLLIPWFDALTRRGALVLIGDPGRSYCPLDRLEKLAIYQVPVTRALAGLLIPWFDALTRRGALVLIGDPGRSYCPLDRLEKLAIYQVPVTRALEDSDIKKTTVWRFL